MLNFFDGVRPLCLCVQASIMEASNYVPLQLMMPPFLTPAIRWLANTFPDAKQAEALRVRLHSPPFDVLIQMTHACVMNSKAENCHDVESKFKPSLQYGGGELHRHLFTDTVSERGDSKIRRPCIEHLFYNTLQTIKSNHNHRLIQKLTTPG